MNKITLLFSLFLSIIFFISCSDNLASEEKVNPENKTSILSEIQHVDTTYMHTGFYFLAEEKIGAIKIRMEKSNDFYLLAKEPFASVVDIKQTELKTTKLEQGDYTELCLTFDNKGTNDLEEGTGNPLHPKIAVIIAGKLLYVVDNTTKFKTGIMCLGLQGYSKSELVKIKTAVDQKN